MRRVRGGEGVGESGRGEWEGGMERVRERRIGMEVVTLVSDLV